MKISLAKTSHQTRETIGRVIDKTAESMNMTDDKVALVMSFFLEYLADEVTKGKTVQLPGFGSFHAVPWRKVGMGRKVKRPYSVPGFVPSTSFRWQVIHGAPANASQMTRYKNAQSNSSRKSRDNNRVFTAQRAIRDAIAHQLAQD